MQFTTTFVSLFPFFRYLFSVYSHIGTLTYFYANILRVSIQIFNAEIENEKNIKKYQLTKEL